MNPLRAFAVTLLVAVGLVAAGCGGGSNSGSSGAIPSSASLAPPDAGLWVSVDTDRASSQWQALDAVLARIPGAEGLVDDALAQIGPEGKKLDFKRDVQPALGKEVVVVLPAGASNPVVLAKPDDPSKLESLVKSSTDSSSVRGERDGWTIFAKDQKTLDAYNATAGKGSLGDSESFKSAMSGLPGDALVRVFVDGSGLAGVAGSASGVASGALQNVSVPGLRNLAQGQNGKVDPKALAKIGTVGAAASAGDHLVRVDGTWQSTTGLDPAGFKPTLLDRVPADALAALSFSGGQIDPQQLRSALEQAGATQLDQVEQTLGVSFDDLLHVADGEGVVYVRPGLLIPEVTGVLSPSDPARALATIDKVVAKLAGSQGAKVTETDQGGIHWKQLSVSIVSIAWGRDGDRVVVTTQPAGVTAFDGNDPKLVDSDRFKTAAADVGLGDTTGGFGYVDVKGLTPLVKTIASAASQGSSSSDPTLDKLVQALDAIDSVAFNSTVDGSTVHFQAALRVRQ